jgi:hypothetical protein
MSRDDGPSVAGGRGHGPCGVEHFVAGAARCVVVRCRQ